MAIYHLHAKIHSRSTGKSAVACAAYRAGEKYIDHRTGLTHDYSRKSGVNHTEILAPPNAPDWVYDREQLWNKVERREDSSRRWASAQVAREIEIALPIELDEENQIKLVREFVGNQFVSEGMVADIALHDTGQGNPHAHILLTMRRLDGQEFDSKKAREWNKVSLLEQWREQWGAEANQALERQGEMARIDHRTLKEQGVDREPINKSQAVYEMEKRGVTPDKYKHLPGSWYELKEQLHYLEKQIEQYEQSRERNLSPAAKAMLEKMENRWDSEKEQEKER